MRKYPIALAMLIVCIILSSCGNPGGQPALSTDLKKYQDIGYDVAARKWTVNYDCSNFSTQFYQNCHNAGLPCRIRAGTAAVTNGFSGGDHAWNSVLIDGKWVNWEPQTNEVFNRHVQTRTYINPSWGNYVEEDIVRIIYETVGRYVPENIIDSYEIDANWNKSPFLPYYLSHAYCISDDPAMSTLAASLQTRLPDNNDGGFFVYGTYDIAIFFKYNSKYYAIDNLEDNDPVDGRKVLPGNALKEAVLRNAVFTKLDVHSDYKTN
ncbi:MAG: transglutaminase domain-containing protein [Treponema sp.]|jgi:hypothetical protein|nr:transglutaminase domain-containing protein [Treponema sp.]